MKEFFHIHYLHISKRIFYKKDVFEVCSHSVYDHIENSYSNLLQKLDHLLRNPKVKRKSSF